MIDDAFITDNLLFQQDSSWAHIDSIFSIPVGNESRMPQPGFTPQSCQACNSVTNSGPGHLDKMLAPVLAEAVSPLSLHQQHHNHHVPKSEMSTPPQSHQTPLHQSSFTRLSESGPQSQPLHIDRGSNRLRRSANMPLINASDNSAAEITRRFGLVFEAMRAAAFRDFDEMAAAYYTAQFEKGSFPGMMQSASRSRRLKAMLLELQEGSGQWPRWESRGLHESVSEATASLCVNEIEGLNEAKVPNVHQSEPASLITAFEALLWDHGRIQGDYMSYSSTPGELKLSEQMEAAPDSMPYLWSLLTELAGAEGVYCDRIARIVLAILLHARRAQ